MEREGERTSSRPLWTADFIAVTSVNLLTFLAFQMVMPVIPVFVRGPLQGTDLAVGLLSGIFTLSAVVARPFMGLLLDTMGRRIVLTVGMIVFALGIFGYGLSETVYILAVFRCIHGLGFAAASTGASTMAADIVPRQRRSEGLGYFGMASTAMGAVAPTLGFWLSGSFSYAVLFNTSVAFSLLAFGVIFLLRETKAAGEEEKSQKSTLPQGKEEGGESSPSVVSRLKNLIEPQAMPASAVMFMITLTYGAVSAFIALYARQLGLDNPGLFFFIYALAIMASRPIAGSLADKYGVRPILIPAMTFVMAGFAMMWQTTGITLLLVGGALFGFGFGGLVPVLLAVAVTQAPDQRRGAATATYYAAFDLGIAVGGTAMGSVAEAWGYSAIFGIQIGIAAVGLLLALRLFPKDSLLESR